MLISYFTNEPFNDSTVVMCTSNSKRSSDQLKHKLFPMNITLFSLLIWAALFLTSCNGEDGFTRQGDHWLKDGSVANTKTKLYDFVVNLFTEYERTFKLQDAAAMAERATDDCVYIHENFGILRGKEAVKNGFQRRFKTGIAGVKFEILEGTDIGTLGDGYIHIIAREYLFDKDGNQNGKTTVLVILKDTEDGYKHYLKAEISDLSETFIGQIVKKYNGYSYGFIGGRRNAGTPDQIVI